MLKELEISDARSTGKHRLKSRYSDKNAATPVGRELLGPVSRVIWPEKPADTLADIAGSDKRTAERWLSGEVEAPPIIFAAILVALTRRR